ncbi:hypothetical protein CPB86DRAFT_562672 [Serendipita vermifera]|nr:hypothetical protein CPB86DRAFT_562672 [Serendipita vermifera]
MNGSIPKILKTINKKNWMHLLVASTVLSRRRNRERQGQAALMTEIGDIGLEVSGGNDNASNQCTRSQMILTEGGFGETKSLIERLPVELLGVIFQSYVDLNLSVWNLTDVCRTWNQVAFSIPTLWNHLLILPAKKVFTDVSSPYNRGDECYFRGRQHICFNDNHLYRCLARCATAPLDIQIELSAEPEEMIASFVRCLKALMVPSITVRMKELSIYWTSGQVMDAFPECFEHARLQNLESLKTDSPLPPRWANDLFSAMSKPTSRLEATNSSSPSNLFEEPWMNLKLLDINSSPQEFNNIAHKIRYVTKITSIPQDWPNRQTPRLTFLNLTVLRISTNPFHFRRIQWPRVQELTVWGKADEPEENSIPEFASFPKLVELRVISEHFELWLSNLSAPNLETLYLNPKSQNLIVWPDFFKSTSVHTFTKIHTLSLSNLYESNVGVVILESLPGIKKLVIQGPNSDPQGPCSLVRHLTQFNGQFIYGPNLEELNLVDYSISTREENNIYKPLIKEFISERERYDAALKKVKLNNHPLVDHTKNTLRNS